jgi:hypothetical protein
MWKFTDPFWGVVFKFSTISAFIAGGIGISSAFISAWVGYQITDSVQRDATVKIAEAQARGDEAKAEAGRANERAEELSKENLDLRQRIAPRRITREQHDVIVNALRNAPATFDIEVMGDGESGAFASDIFKTLTDAGWTAGQKSFPLGEIWTGLSVFTTNDPAAIELIKAFQAAQIFVAVGNSPRPRATIMVGAKPAAF